MGPGFSHILCQAHGAISKVSRRHRKNIQTLRGMSSYIPHKFRYDQSTIEEAIQQKQTLKMTRKMLLLQCTFAMAT